MRQITTERHDITWSFLHKVITCLVDKVNNYSLPVLLSKKVITLEDYFVIVYAATFHFYNCRYFLQIPVQSSLLNIPPYPTVQLSRLYYNLQSTPKSLHLLLLLPLNPPELSLKSSL